MTHGVEIPAPSARQRGGGGGACDVLYGPDSLVLERQYGTDTSDNCRFAYIMSMIYSGHYSEGLERNLLEQENILKRHNFM